MTLSVEVHQADGGIQSPTVSPIPSATRLVLVYLVLHTLVLWAFAVIAHASGDLPHDMTEAWDWGKKFQWGYYKHPPLFPWIAGAWLKLWPRTDWSC